MENQTIHQSLIQNITESELTLHVDALTPEQESRIEKHCILLHGWNSTGKDMLRIKDAIAQLPAAHNYRFWWITYDTNAPFKENAQKIIALLNQQNTNFNNCLMVCYSMGGVVGRSMYAQGFNVNHLVTICTPHLGLAPWIPTPTPGTMSIAPWSQDLKELNSHPRDMAKRNNFHFFGITYTDLRGYHDDDAVVEFNSATGNLLGNLNRFNIPLNYNGGLAGMDPHSRGMDPNYLQVMLQHVRNLL